MKKNHNLQPKTYNLEKRSFAIRGMHCASCVRVLERSLGKVDGVSSAVVNLATEKASIEYDPKIVSDDNLSSAVSKVGYEAVLKDKSENEDEEAREKENTLRQLRNKVIISLISGGLILWGSFPGL